jgi:hypothetical protein
MSESISSVGKQYKNLPNRKCQLLDNNGIVIAEFEGEVQEIYCRLFVVKECKMYDIVNEDENWILQEHLGEIPIK